MKKQIILVGLLLGLGSVYAADAAGEKAQELNSAPSSQNAPAQIKETKRYPGYAILSALAVSLAIHTGIAVLYGAAFDGQGSSSTTKQGLKLFLKNMSLSVPVASVVSIFTPLFTSKTYKTRLKALGLGLFIGVGACLVGMRTAACDIAPCLNIDL